MSNIEKKIRLNDHIDFKLCLVCQTYKEEELVEKPNSHEKLLNAIKERSEYADSQFMERWSVLKNVNVEEIVQKGTWHRKCYQETTHSGMLKRARERYDRELSGPNESRRKKSDTKLTRSQTAPYNKETCFFCDQKAQYSNPLHLIRSDSAGESLQTAVEKSGDPKLLVKLSTAVDKKDAHAIDAKYHKTCWAKHVTSVLRQPSSTFSTTAKQANEIAAKIEFIEMTKMILQSGQILNMAELQEAFEKISSQNNVKGHLLSRKSIKELIQKEIVGVEFHKPKRVNEPERVSVKKGRDNAISLSETSNESPESNMKVLFDAATILRKAINKSKKWIFTGSLDTLTGEHCPEELYSFFRWTIKGTSTAFLEDDDEKSFEVHRRAILLAQSVSSMCLSERQVKNKKSEAFNYTREMPHQLAVGLATHQAVRSKEIVNLLHGFGMSVDYNRLLRVEAQIEKNVLQRMEDEGGVYLPPDVVKGRPISFAIDNSDFSEDTPDGKRTLHGTAMAIYQKKDDKDKDVDIKLDLTSNEHCRSIKNVPESISTLLECPAPPERPVSSTYPTFGLLPEDKVPITVSLDDFAWLLSRIPTDYPEDSVTQEDEEKRSKVPVWSGYNSLLIKQALPETRVGAPPLLAHPAHEWNTLYTILMQAQNINTKIVGPQRKTIISLDLALYMSAKKLQMHREDLNHIVLRPGELHICMAMQKTIGSFIEESGIDMSWNQSELYGPLTTKQIIDGKHVRRGQRAHITTLQALFILYYEAFEKEQPLVCKSLQQSAKDVSDACKSGTRKEVEKAHRSFINKISNLKVLEKLQEFDEANKSNPLFLVTRHYMRMVMEMLLFVKSVRSGNWELHLKALELFTKYFFAHDKINYARMIPIYLAEMASLEETDPEIYKEFLDGNWVVNKNGKVPFCAVGADTALEHINRSMKVSGGLIGITLNEAARNKFFLISPELAKLAEEAKGMAGLSKDCQGTPHHNLSSSVAAMEEKNVLKLMETIKIFKNPFETADGPTTDLYNIVTNVVLPENVKDDLCQQSSIGRMMFSSFVEERITSGKKTLWAPMKKRKLLTWKSSGKVIKVKAQDKEIELKEDRNLFARLMMICKSRPEVDIKEAVGKFEFSVVPRSMFAPDGTMIHCSNKAALLHILEDMKVEGDTAITTDNSPAEQKVSVVDGMAEVQALDKPHWINNCGELAEHFADRIFTKYGDSHEIHLVFDRYDIESSLKTATRLKRQGSTVPVYYRVTESTQIHKVPLKKLVSHPKTKNELATFLAKTTLEFAATRGKQIVVAWGKECKASHKDVSHLQSNHEEADTKLILHAVDASAQGANEVHIHSPDTDVLVLAIRRSANMCGKTFFVTGTASRRRTINLKAIADTLGPLKTAALPAFHAVTGADITGSMSGKGKVTCWKVFEEADQSVVEALVNLGVDVVPSEEVMIGIEKFVCQLYQPKTDVETVQELRWLLFRKKQAQSERLPPTQAALAQAILRAHYQMLIWNSDILPNPELPPPEGYGWTMNQNVWEPIMTTLQPAPKAVLQLVKCGCSKETCTTNRCQCRKAKLRCTDLCSCLDHDKCENQGCDETNDVLCDTDSDSDLE